MGKGITTKTVRLRGRLLGLSGDDKVVCSVDAEVFSGWDDGGGAVFGDDSGAGVVLAGAEGVSGVDFRFLFLAFEEDREFERGEPAERCSAWTAEGGRPHMIFFHHMVHFLHTSLAGLQDGAEAEGY